MINGLALCAGIGGLEIGLGRAIGDYRTVCHVEREVFAAAVLVARMEDAYLEQAPIWDDVTTFDGTEWCGKVDLVTAGLPCQPYSIAGKQRGNSDNRALWPAFARIVEEVEPATIFIENVPLFLRHFEPAHRRLRDLGFEFAPPLLLTAQEVGATDGRKRLFVAATHTDRKGLEGWGVRQCERPDERPSRSVRSEAPGWCGWLFDRERLRHDGASCGAGCRIRGTWWDSEFPVCRVADRTPYWMDELRVLGNCVTPDQAEYAWNTMMEYRK